VTDLAGRTTEIQDKLQSYKDAAASRTVELARQAIASWRHLAGLDNSANETTSVNKRHEVASQAEFVLAR
jgi:hypothetical protein